MFTNLKQVLQVILIIIITIGLLLIGAILLMFDFAVPTWIVLFMGAVGILMIFITLKD